MKLVIIEAVTRMHWEGDRRGTWRTLLENEPKNDRARNHFARVARQARTSGLRIVAARRILEDARARYDAYWMANAGHLPPHVGYAPDADWGG